MVPKRLFVTAALVAPSSAWTVFTVPHTSGRDDTPGVMQALSVGNVTSNATILFEKGTTYNIFTPISFPIMHNVEVAIEGNLTYPTDIPTIQAEVASSSYPGAWFAFSGGTNVTLRGTTDPNWGWVDAHGQAWWDANQQTNRPHGFAFSKVSGGAIRDMKIWKPIGWNFATSGSSNVQIVNNQILAASTTGRRQVYTASQCYSRSLLCPGFSAGGTNLSFSSNYVVNGDDCLTVGNGAKNIHWIDSYCEGGHGLSIGSLGEDGQVADVENVLIENTVMNNTLYAARFKSWTGGNGAARNITWRNIAFNNVPFPDGPPPPSNTANNTRVEDFLFQNFAGTIEESVSDPIPSPIIFSPFILATRSRKVRA
ncbi:glycoside hydrolase family 28 protein [Phanerochaete carnosa HHB-10118-sp]|uniref:galacturonan 1,4-alpha-galacturonidase n=1 Tax=Phanerochaete carnosa (strain HHB-10118-sp) TaxID=650164 RepID=K5WD08_PHACS|nr:glycoside hydrolase family 28 protein [Phanerochaete carnosa HHB-10118-sp]EKM61813.1 glycoside hydrolase family 28 protein [Phanerochaete carnosa HHB-10118-sp]